MQKIVKYVLTIFIVLAILFGLYMGYKFIEKKREIKPEEKISYTGDYTIENKEEEKEKKEENKEKLEEEKAEDVSYMYNDGAEICYVNGDKEEKRATLGNKKISLVKNDDGSKYYAYLPEEKKIYVYNIETGLDIVKEYTIGNPEISTKNSLSGVLLNEAGEVEGISLNGKNSGLYSVTKDANNLTLALLNKNDIYSVKKTDTGYILGLADKVSFTDKDFKETKKIETGRPVVELNEDDGNFYALVRFSEGKDSSLLFKINKETLKIENIKEIDGRDSFIVKAKPLLLKTRNELINLEEKLEN